MKKNATRSLTIAGLALLLTASASFADVVHIDQKQASSGASGTAATSGPGGSINTIGNDESRNGMDVESWFVGGSGQEPPVIRVFRKQLRENKPGSERKGRGGVEICEPTLVSQLLQELFDIDVPCK